MMSEDSEGTTTCERAAMPHVTCPTFIKRDDERLGPRYMQRDYSHAPAGAIPNRCRREMQVASALRRRTDSVIASLICGADGKPGGARGDACLCTWACLRGRPAGAAA